MKKTGIFNNTKIIIFVLLVIGIILLSPIINKSVYAKTGKLPAEITKGLFKEAFDEVTKALDLSSKKYTATDVYKRNEAYLRVNGYNVSPAITEGDEFWTAKGSALQQFDDNYQEDSAIVKDDGTDLINGNTLRPWVFQDLITYKDVYCAHRGTRIFQGVPDMEATFKLPEGSELAKRLRHFVVERNKQLGQLTTIQAGYNLDSNIATEDTVLDDYNIHYNNTNLPENIRAITVSDMKVYFDYTYTGANQTNVTFPYVMEKIQGDDASYAKYIVPTQYRGSLTHQDIGAAYYDQVKSKDVFLNATSADRRESIYARGIDRYIAREIGILYDPEKIIGTAYVDWTSTVADTVNMIRTYSFYKLAESGRVLSPQSAYGFATESKNKSPAEKDYPGGAQEVSWSMVEKDGYVDPRGSQATINYIPVTEVGKKTKALAEAFAAHYQRLVEWKKKNADKYIPAFLDTERNIIFNAKSTKYEEGAWLVGPYGIDYLLSTVTHNGKELYFAGMTDMIVYGEYTDSVEPIKEIKKWSYFVPLQSSNTTLTIEEIAAGKVTNLKYGVPEPNQEFYLEIPYDENLISIAELKASFKALDYTATANYYVGMGEYVDFSVEIIQEEFDKISYEYANVQLDGEPVFFKEPNSDLGILTVKFKEKIFLKGGNPDPFSLSNDGDWQRVNDFTISRTINYYQKDFTSYTPMSGFYYAYGGNSAVGSRDQVVGGMSGNGVAFGKPYTGPVRISQADKNSYKKLDISSTSYEDATGQYVLIRSTNGLKFYDQQGSLVSSERIYKLTYPRDVVIKTPGGQKSNPIRIPSKEIGIPTIKVVDTNDDYYFITTAPHATKVRELATPSNFTTGEYSLPRPNQGVTHYRIYTSSGREDTVPVPASSESGFIQKPNLLTNKVYGVLKGIIGGKSNENTVITANATNRIEAGETKRNFAPPRHYYVSDGGGTGASYTKPLNDDHTYVLSKHPDILVIPKAKLLKVPTQPQMSVEGYLFWIEVDISLKENLALERPGFLLPIGGKVWEDKPYGDKFSTYNFILNTGSLDKEDKMLEEINVRVNRLIIRNSDKAIIEKQAARVFEKGEYKKPIGRDEIKTDAKGEWGKYYLRDLGFTRAEIAKGYKSSTHMVKFEVEFEYDGIKYAPVPPLASLDYDANNLKIETAETAENDSVAVENVIDRETFNKNIGEINGGTPINASRTTTGKAIGVAGVSGADIGLTYSGELDSRLNRTVSTLETKVNTRASTLNTGLLYPLGDVYSIDMKQAMSDYSATSPTNGSFDVVVIMNTEKAKEFKNKEGVTVTDALENKSVVVFHETNTHMENINLGLMERKQVDLELESDLMLSIQFVNKKALVNTFANKYDLDKDPNDEFSYLISKYSKNSDDLQYQLDIYKADYIYRTAMYKDPDIEAALDSEAARLAAENKDSAGRELDVYLQYKQAISNYSQLDHAIVSGVNMYFDTSLTPILDAPIIKEIDKDTMSGQTATGKAAIAGDNIIIGTPEYRIVTLDTMFSRDFDEVGPESQYTDIPVHGPYTWTAENTGDVKKLTSLHNSYNANDILLPSARRLEIVTNFRINKDAIFQENGVTTSNSIRLGNKHHLTEIAGYATYDKYTGKITGKVDFDSAPGNVNLDLLKFNIASFNGELKQDFSYLEDDSSTAPMIAIELEKEAPREVSGMIWEEKRNMQVARVNMGDGIYNQADGEKPIPDKIVALEERVSIKAIDLSTAYKMSQGFDNTILRDTSYYVDIPYIWENKIQRLGISVDNLKSTTGFQSYVRTGTDGKYKFTGVPAGNFVVQLPYITVGNSVTQELGILDENKIETTKIVEIDSRDKSPQVYNGQDFKVSIYDAGNRDTLNETWLPSDPKANYSYGRDSEYDRYKLYQSSRVVDAKVGDALEILNIKHDEFDTETKKIIEETANMRAETPLINFGINYYGSINKKEILYSKFKNVFALPGITTTNDGLGDVESTVSTRKYENVNIALEERPKTKLVLDKQITRLTLKSSDGTKIVDAKYTTTYDIDNIIMPKVDKLLLTAETTDKNYDAKRKTSNGYSTEEYILKVKTEVEPDSINGDKVRPLNTSIYATKKPYWEDTKAVDNIYTNARGWENKNDNDGISRMSNGYIHLNFDKQLLSDMNIEIEYQVQLYNVGEVDRASIQEEFKNQSLEAAEKDERISKYVGKLAPAGEGFSKLNHEIDRNKYGFGRFFGIGYYTGNYATESTIGNYKIYKEKVGKTYANKIVDYVDNGAVKDDLQDDDWAQIKTPSELENLVAVYDNSGKKTFALQTDNMLDPDGKSYFATGGSNIYLNDTMNIGLIPFYEYITARSRGVPENSLAPYEANSTIAIKRLSSQQADEDLSFDNIAEIVEYATDSGRRTISSTPGNINTRLSETFRAQNLESDTGLALQVTITPPTGLSQAQRTMYTTLNITLATMAGLAIIAVVTKLIFNTKQKKVAIQDNNKEKLPK